MNNSKFFLTDNGNVFAVREDHAVFYAVNGDFLRLATYSEAQHLSGILQPVEFQVLPDFEQPVLWKALWSKRTSDYSSWKPETCFNGGDYAFFVDTTYFARKTRRGWQFCAIDLHRTSAEFEYDELDGSFQTGCELVDVIGVDSQIMVCTQTKFNEIVLDQIARTCELPFCACDVIYDPAEGKELEKVPIGYTDLKKRVERLREIGYSRPSASERHKARRRR